MADRHGQDRDQFELDGVMVELRRSARRRRTVSAGRQGQVVVVHLPMGLSSRQEMSWARELVPKVLAKEARTRVTGGSEELMQRGTALASRHLDPVVGHPVRPTSIRWVDNQQRRWGSCSIETGQIRLSARLRAMPDWVVDYVLLHELVHLVEHDHTTRFHELAAAHPRAERARGFLEGWSAATQGGAGSDACDAGAGETSQDDEA